MRRVGSRCGCGGCRVASVVGRPSVGASWKWLGGARGLSLLLRQVGWHFCDVDGPL